MRRSQFTENEILHLLCEASSARLRCRNLRNAAGVIARNLLPLASPVRRSQRAAPILQMKELAAENVRRLRGLVSNLFERLRKPRRQSAPPQVAPTIAASEATTGRAGRSRR